MDRVTWQDTLAAVVRTLSEVFMEAIAKKEAECLARVDAAQALVTAAQDRVILAEAECNTYKLELQKVGYELELSSGRGPSCLEDTAECVRRRLSALKLQLDTAYSARSSTVHAADDSGEASDAS